MPYTPKENKRFLELLVAERELPLPSVFAIFANRKGQINRDAAETTLRGLQNGELFTLLNAKGDEVRWEDPVFERPEDYKVRFNGIDGIENLMAKRFSDLIDAERSTEIAPGYVWTTVHRPEQLRIVGSREGAAVLAERIRAFTHHWPSSRKRAFFASSTPAPFPVTDPRRGRNVRSPNHAMLSKLPYDPTTTGEARSARSAQYQTPSAPCPSSGSTSISRQGARGPVFPSSSQKMVDNKT